MGQFMATKALHRLLEFADEQRYAGFLAKQLREPMMRLGSILHERQRQLAEGQTE